MVEKRVDFKHDKLDVSTNFKCTRVGQQGYDIREEEKLKKNGD